MKVIKFQAENVKRLKVVEFTPNSDVQIVSGDNAQGKSSVLDALWLAIAGADASKSVKSPIRNGEEHASVVLNLGNGDGIEYIVTREWSNGKSTLSVKAASGAKFDSPQRLLDSLLGSLTFDPLAFIRLEPKKQLEALLALVELDINLEAHEIARQRLYENRTEHSRELKSLKTQLEALGEIEDAPEQAISVTDLANEYTAIKSHVSAWADLNRRNERAVSELSRLLLLVNDATLEVENATKELDQHNKKEIRDPDIVEAELNGAEEINAKVARNEQRKALAGKLHHQEGVAKTLTGSLEAMDYTKAEALSEAEFPVAGLGFTEDGVTFNGLPLSDASDSEKIKVSLGMAMALNPQIRVIRIMDGSLLDKKNLEIISEMAKEKDFQIWIEIVGDNGVGIVMEDGEVVKDYSK